MALINFTAVYDQLAVTTDDSDAGADSDIIALIGEVTFTPVFNDDKPILAPGYAPRPTGFKLLPIKGFIDSDGQLKSARSGTVGVRLPANDPVLGLSSLHYRVDFDLRTPIGEKVSVGGGYFQAPSTDTTLNLVSVLQQTGSPGIGITKGLQGDRGPAGTIAVGTVTTLGASAAATVTNSGSSSSAVFNFGLPRGDAVNSNDIGYDVIILAGQSNMAGRGTPYSISQDPLDSRVLQYAASGTYSGQIISAVDPLAMPSGDTVGIGPGLWFGRWYASSAPTNRRVLLVPTAVGGTPLVTSTPPTWNSTVSGSLYSQMISLTQAALTAAGSNSRVVACLWIQGETDAQNNVTGANYQTALDALVAKLRTDLSLPSLPFIIGQMVPELLPYPLQTRTAINTVQAAIQTRVANTSFVQGPFGQVKDDYHYLAAGQRILARSMFDGLQRIIKSESDPALPSVPGQVSGVTVSNLSAATFTASWSPVSGAQGYFVEHATTSGGTYSYATTSTTTSATVTRLSSGVAEWVRVTAVDSAGGGTPSTAVQAATSSDTTPPSAPGTPTATAGTNSVTVTFSAASDNVAVTGYRVFSSADSYTTAIATGSASPITVGSLTAGSAITLKVSAIDAAGNESAKTAASNSVTPTAPSYFVQDTFTDTAGTALSAHTPNIGSAYVPLGGSFVNTFTITAAGKAYPAATTEAALNNATPPSADYTVGADVTWVSPLPSTQRFSLYARARQFSAGPNTYQMYELRYVNGLLTLLAWPNVVSGAGLETNLGTFSFTPTAGTTYRLTLTCNGTAISGAIDGTTRISATNSSITTAGLAGFGTNAWAPTGGAGATIDNFTAG